jgi:hypothetical protein
MEIIKGQHIEGELVQVDGKHFIDCTLRRCVLEYGGGTVVMERTRVSGCHHVFCGAARLTVNYLECMGLFPHTGEQVYLPGPVIH